jgi:hypothetical protein
LALAYRLASASASVLALVYRLVSASALALAYRLVSASVLASVWECLLSVSVLVLLSVPQKPQC